MRNGFENIYEIPTVGGHERQLTDLKNKYGVLGAYEMDADSFIFCGRRMSATCGSWTWWEEDELLPFQECSARMI